MIRGVLSGVAGAWIARNVERGDIPEKFAVPLAFLAARIPTPILLAGAIGYGFYRWKQEIRATTARDVTPDAPTPSAKRARPSTRRTTASRGTAKPVRTEGKADV